jgi:hypothetical protein
MNTLIIGESNDGTPVKLNLNVANRHGLIIGATGTGKSVTLQRLAEGFLQEGVSVIAPDIKGDLSALANLTENNVVLWSLSSELGHPVRSTVTEFGPLLLSEALGLSEAQSSVLYIIFKIAEDEKLLLLKLDDLKALLVVISNNLERYEPIYGKIAPATLSAIQRKLLVFTEQHKENRENFFYEPALNILDLLSTTERKAAIHLIDAQDSLNNPATYCTFILWLISEAFEKLPEVGDLRAPKLVIFFDEAHLLFNAIKPSLLQRVETLVRLIRSKGVSIFFISQRPDDIPETILSQLGNKIIHGLRAFTPKEKRAIKALADGLPDYDNPDKEKSDYEATILSLSIGEALISFLAPDGKPLPAECVKVSLPKAPLGKLSPVDRERIVKNSPYACRVEFINRPGALAVLEERASKPLVSKKSLSKEFLKAGISGAKSAFTSLVRKVILLGIKELKRGIFGSSKRSR